MKYLLIILVLISFAACGGSSSLESKVQSYGKQNFVRDVLAFLENGTLDASIQAEFSPKDVRTYLNGVLLVFKESRRWIAGIYVDAESLSGCGGSGLEVWP
jgi:hypothetical protein